MIEVECRDGGVMTRAYERGDKDVVMVITRSGRMPDLAMDEAVILMRLLRTTLVACGVIPETVDG